MTLHECQSVLSMNKNTCHHQIQCIQDCLKTGCVPSKLHTTLFSVRHHLWLGSLPSRADARTASLTENNKIIIYIILSWVHLSFPADRKRRTKGTGGSSITKRGAHFFQEKLYTEITPLLYFKLIPCSFMTYCCELFQSGYLYLELRKKKLNSALKASWHKQSFNHCFKYVVW